MAFSPSFSASFGFFIRRSICSASSSAFLNLVSGASCDVKFVNAIDVDSSGGRLITDVKGTLLRTVNWYKTNPDYFSFF